MKTILKTIITILILITPVYSQSNQIEGRFIYHPNQDKVFNTDGYGAGITLTTNLGEYIKLLNSLDFEKTRNGNTLNNFSQRDITIQSTIRLYPIEEYYSIKPFVQGGIRVRANKFKSSSLIDLPISPGFVSTDQKRTYSSPFIGVGINIKDLYILDYSHLFTDFSSKTEISQFGPGFFRERGDVLQAKAFIPISKKFLFTPAYQVSRTRFEFFPYQWDHKLSFGLALKFGHKEEYPKPNPTPLPPLN
jgi:hypothetical protein